MTLPTRPLAIFSTLQGTQNPDTKPTLQRAKNANAQPAHHPADTTLIGLTFKHQLISFINNPQSVNNFSWTKYVHEIFISYIWTKYVLKMPTIKKSISTIGEQLRTLRENANLSLREVATNIGIDTSLLGKIERNERQPTKEQIKQVATFFKVNEKQLIKEMLSDQFAYKIIEEEADLDTLKVAEEKVEYLKKHK
ncbi:MAG: helix-turn-helix domain-containing protein [Chitinophagaceae bacterium]|nr:helix-turn-helix domain-containing protein [Chitinophagaceae bacterium]